MMLARVTMLPSLKLCLFLILIGSRKRLLLARAACKAKWLMVGAIQPLDQAVQALA